MENAVQSYLQVSGLPPTDVARVLLLRAQTRLAAGYRTSAQQGHIYPYLTQLHSQNPNIFFQIYSLCYVQIPEIKMLKL